MLRGQVMRPSLTCLGLMAVLAAAPAWAQTTNQLFMTGTASGSEPSISANGIDANISINLMPKGSGGVGIGTTSPGAPLQVSLSNTATSGTNYGVEITPTYNQASGTAANTDLLVNRTQTAAGSGNQYLLDLQVGGSSQLHVDNLGNATASGLITATNTMWSYEFNAFNYTTTSASLVYPGGAVFHGRNTDTLDSSIAPLVFQVSNTAGTLQSAYIGALANTGTTSFTPTIVIGQQVTNSSSYAERMRIDGSGNVGIRTASPQATLDIAGFERLALNSSAPATCGSGNEGAIALTHLAQVCICDTTPAWHVLNTGTACSW
jgi:hypothetical protein